MHELARTSWHARVGKHEHARVGKHEHARFGMHEHARFGMHEHARFGMHEHARFGMHEHARVGGLVLPTLGRTNRGPCLAGSDDESTKFMPVNINQ